MKSEYVAPSFEIIRLTLNSDVLTPSDEYVATEAYIEDPPDDLLEE